MAGVQSSNGEEEHTIERQTWAAEVEVFDLTDAGELTVDRSESRGPVKTDDTLECSCGREFDDDEVGRELAAEHLRTVRAVTD